MAAHHRFMDTLNPAVTAAPADCPVVELRQYILHPGRRDALINLFDREFVETQEAVGLGVIGQFRDLDDADRFAWLRGFADMDARRVGLQAFYGGPVWAAHRDAANATMVDSSDVWLLQPAWPGAGLSLQRGGRAAQAATASPPGVVLATVCPLLQAADEALLQACRARPPGAARRQGWYVTEPARNDFPRLPVHEGQPVLVHLALYDDAAGAAQAEPVAALLHGRLSAPAQIRRWAPTARSALHA
jgi:hypothetical protein